MVAKSKTPFTIIYQFTCSKCGQTMQTATHPDELDMCLKCQKREERRLRQIAYMAEIIQCSNCDNKATRSEFPSYDEYPRCWDCALELDAAELADRYFGQFGQDKILNVIQDEIKRRRD